ncbi:hypothetical protein [Adlercreutzia aquisgranensis]|uniref:hypothetical protein n=1 Tax=Adlercreutzia aquisgranensis TaxID=2941323 RepID=UPI00203C4897|nr:hypothetical protein [Adlercreutzia aquisgranensis]
MAITFLQSIGEGGKAAVLTMARPLVLFVPMVLLVPMTRKQELEQRAIMADKTVLKMMREMGISCGIRRETDYHRYNSYKGKVSRAFENVIGRDFGADGPWEKMGTDVCGR